jgi:hypothetical protein
MNVDQTLTDIGATELIGGLMAWSGHALCPYTDSELRAFASMDASMDASMNEEMRSKFIDFRSKLEALPENERVGLKTWAHAQFVEATWQAKGRQHPRPQFACDNFFNVHKRSGKLLDVAPAHGVHGLLLFRDHYKIPFEYHAADTLPAYNKLLSVLGVDVTHYNANFDRLAGGPYDAVTCTEFLEHVDQAAEDRILEDITNVTTKGSTLLITFPVKALPYGRIDTDPMGHVRQPSVAEIIGKLCEFRVVNHGKFAGSKYDQNFLIGERK